jgi:hypothetical protein
MNPKVSLAIVAGVVLPVTLLAQQVPAGASTAPPPKTLAHDLVAATYLQHQGFTKAIEKTKTTGKTGQKGCPNGAQEIYENPTGQESGVEVEIVACTTVKAATTLISMAKSSASASSSSTPPKKLGSSAIEQSGGGSSPSYAVYWQRGKLLGLVVYTTNIKASSSSTSTSTTVAAPPITSTEQAMLTRVALEQDSRL